MSSPTYQRGFQLLELLVALAVFGLVVSLSFPALLRASSGVRVGLAASEVAATFHQARAFAIRHSANVAVRFQTEGARVTWALFQDGNGNGVRNRDIDRGLDPRVTQERELGHLGAAVRFGIPKTDPPPRKVGGHGRMNRLEDPVRFNRSDLASFGPMGTATPGSVYLTDGRDHLVVVRILGRTGRIRTLAYDFDTETWR
jgi:prepilin-type N-terminal cleavage/methylation domain-containing protein